MHAFINLKINGIKQYGNTVLVGNSAIVAHTANIKNPNDILCDKNYLYGIISPSNTNKAFETRNTFIQLFKNQNLGCLTACLTNQSQD